MRRTTIEFGCTILTSLGFILAAGCKREERSFRMPPPSVQASEIVPYLSTLRPGPESPMVASTSQPINVARVVYERYGSQFANNAQALSDGQMLYEAFNCVGCHAHGGGGIGPPLLDNKWFYGSEPQNVYQTILNGRPNGMPAFRGRIPDYQIWELVAFVRSMSGLANTNAAGGREDHMNTGLPPNSTPAETPQKVPEPTTGPTTKPTPKSTTGQTTAPTTVPGTEPTTKPATTTTTTTTTRSATAPTTRPPQQ